MFLWAFKCFCLLCRRKRKQLEHRTLKSGLLQPFFHRCCCHSTAHWFSSWISETKMARYNWSCRLTLFNPFILAYIDCFLFLIVRLLHGFAWGWSTTANGTAAVELVPTKRLGEGMGYYGLSITIGMIIAPSFGILLFQHLGFQPLIIGSAIFGVISIIALSLVQYKTPKSVLEKSMHVKDFSFFAHSLINMGRFLHWLHYYQLSVMGELSRLSSYSAKKEGSIKSSYTTYVMRWRQLLYDQFQEGGLIEAVLGFLPLFAHS